MPRKDLLKAIAYFRTSSETNVEKDSVKRQREAVARYAKSGKPYAATAVSRMIGG